MEDIHTKYNQQRRGNKGEVTEELENEIGLSHVWCCGLCR